MKIDQYCINTHTHTHKHTHTCIRCSIYEIGIDCCPFYNEFSTSTGNPFCVRHTLHFHFHLSLNHRGRWVTTDNLTASFLHSSVLHCPLRLGELQADPYHNAVFPPLFLSQCLPCLLPPCMMVLARRDECETWPYHFS